MEGMGVGEGSGEMRWNVMIEPGLDMDIIPLYWCAILGCFYVSLSLYMYMYIHMHLYIWSDRDFRLNFGVTGRWEKNYSSSYCWCFQKYGSGMIWIHTMPETNIKFTPEKTDLEPRGPMGFGKHSTFELWKRLDPGALYFPRPSAQRWGLDGAKPLSGLQKHVDTTPGMMGASFLEAVKGRCGGLVGR